MGGSYEIKGKKGSEIMCNVCIAQDALKAGGWKSKDGFEVRAKSRNAEFSPAQFQIRREGEPWGKHWVYTYDLAGSISHLGFDIQPVPPQRLDIRQRIIEELKTGPIYCYIPALMPVPQRRVKGLTKYCEKRELNDDELPKRVPDGER